MTQEQFLFWLQGFVELTGGETPTQEQWESIVEHLGTVFNKVTKPVAKKEPAQQILVEKADPAKDDKQKADTKKEDPIFDKTFWDQITKQMEDWERIKRETEPGIPYQYPPLLPNQPGWPGIYPTPTSPDYDRWYDPNGFPRIIC